jgi:hypothetical protein
MEIAVKFIPQPLYPHGKNPQHPLNRKLDRTQSQSGCLGKEKNLFTAPVITPTMLCNLPTLLGKEKKL